MGRRHGDPAVRSKDHVGPAYDFSLRRISLMSGFPLLEFGKTGDLRLEDHLTLRKAACGSMNLPADRRSLQY